MANNQYVNKVIFGDITLIDLTGDTITPEDLAQGVTAHDKSGASIVGTGGVTPTIPDGSTVTPINDVVIWQKCAGIANPTYTKLSEILADVGILKTLMADENAVDYLVRCKNFIKQITVPTMTSNTTPSGEASASGYAENMLPYKAFDGDATGEGNNRWLVGGSSDVWLQYQFPTKVTIRSMLLTNSESNTTTQEQNIKNFKVQGSDDGITFDDLGTFLNSDKTIRNVSFNINNVSPYYYYRLYVIDNWGQPVTTIHELQLYSDYGITENQDAMTYIGMFDYAADTLLADADWCDAICNSAYFESVLNVKVPKMTSNNTPSGVCSAQETQSTKQPYYAFDGNNSTAWYPTTKGGSSGLPNSKWLQYQFEKSPFKLCRVDFQAWSSDNSGYREFLTRFKLEGSTDGSTFSEIVDDQSQDWGASTPNPTISKAVNLSVKYNYYRLTAYTYAENSVVENPSLRAVQFYGRERGTIQSWLYKAGITDKTYTDISEVLNDPITLSALMSNQNAVNYLVTVKKWVNTICADATAMSVIGANNYCSDTLLSDSDWRDAIFNSSYFESVLNVKVPTMTSYNTPSGECTGSTNTGENYVYKAFDGNIATYFSTFGTSQSTSPDQLKYAEYDFELSKRIYGIAIQFHSNSGSISGSKYKIQWSDDNSTWTDITERSFVKNDKFAISESNHRYFRLMTYSGTHLTSSQAYILTIFEMQFYGREDV